MSRSAITPTTFSSETTGDFGISSYPSAKRARARVALGMNIFHFHTQSLSHDSLKENYDLGHA